MKTGSGDIAAVFARYREEMLRWAQRALGSQADAEDAVQEVMLFLLRSPHLLAGVDRLGGWLYTLVRRRCVDLVRGESRRRAREELKGLEEVFEGSDPATLLERREFQEAFAAAVRALPEELGAVFIAHALEDRTFREISEETGVPMGTLMARKQRAVEALRARMVAQGAVEPARGKECER